MDVEDFLAGKAAGACSNFAFIHCRDTEFVVVFLHSLIRLHGNFIFSHISVLSFRRSLWDIFYPSSFRTETVWYTCTYMCIKETRIFVGVLRIRASVLLGHAAGVTA